jgi:hypothetical protein
MASIAIAHCGELRAAPDLRAIKILGSGPRDRLDRQSPSQRHEANRRDETKCQN